MIKVSWLDHKVQSYVTVISPNVSRRFCENVREQIATLSGPRRWRITDFAEAWHVQNEKF